MKERPILFSTPMVRAIIDGTKTQTRRLVKRTIEGSPYRADWIELPGAQCTRTPPCPYGKPGDRLWVRETWAFGIHAMAATRDEDGPFVYAADGTTQGRLCERWRPSIHMPRAACRILLEIVDVRLERLQAISWADALAEGIIPAGDDNGYQLADTTHYSATPIDSYFSLWDSINGPSSIEANPWVWVVKFKCAPH